MDENMDKILVYFCAGILLILFGILSEHFYPEIWKFLWKDVTICIGGGC